MMTRRAKVLASCLIAVFAALAVISAIASAEMLLPEFEGPATTGTSSGTTGKLTVTGGASLIGTTTKSTYGLEPGSKKLGTFDIMFEGVTQGGELCRSLGDALGLVLVTGTWHLVLWDDPADIHLIWALIHELHIECPGAAIKLLLVLGTVLGSIAALSGSEKEFGVTVKDNEGTAQEFSEYENDAGTGVKTTLETIQEGTGKPKASLEEAKGNLLTFNTTTKLVK